MNEWRNRHNLNHNHIKINPSNQQREGPPYIFEWRNHNHIKINPSNLEGERENQMVYIQQSTRKVDFKPRTN